MLATFSIGIFSQSAVDPISGGAGWVGAGLLGAVLSWLLLKHLPEKDKYIKDIIKEHGDSINRVTEKHETAVKLSAEKHAAAVEALAIKTENIISRVADKHAQAVDTMTKTFTVSLDTVVVHCKEEMDRILGYWTSNK